jgi:integrase
MYLDRVVGIKDSTKRHYRLKLTDALQSLGREPISALTPDRLRAFVADRRLKTSDIQVRHELTALSAMCEWACDGGYLEMNPVRLVRRKSLGRAASHSRAIKPNDLTKFLDFLKEADPDFYFPFTVLVLETGMRHEEALGLQWEDIDLKRGMIDLPWQKEKTSRGRIIPLTNTALDTLASVRKCVGSPWVFTNPRTRTRYTSIWKQWGRLRDRAGVGDIRIHDLRHTFASYTRRMGMSALDRMPIMGHSSEVTHQNYAATDERSLRDVMNRFSPSTLLAQERKSGEPEDEKGE